MKIGAQIITYWLCPAEPARNQCAGLIADLAARFDAPLFEPHVTISVTNVSENSDAILDEVLKGRSCYRLLVRGVEWSGAFTKTLFIQFEPDGQLARLSEDLRRASGSPNDDQLSPHLSLLYKDLDTETKRQLAGSIHLPFDEIVFDTVKAVISPAEIHSPSEVEAWRVVAKRPLQR